MNVLFVSAEAAPFAKTGGLADVVGSLPAALRAQGVDARVLIPFYGFMDYHKFGLSHLFSFWLPRRTGSVEVHIHTALRDDVPVYFLQGWPYFGQEAGVYDGWALDVPRFIFFCQAAMGAAWELRQRFGWFPDVFHANDWHTGLLPFLLAENRADPVWGQARSVLTLHNMAYQGNNAGGWLWEQGIPGRHQPDLVYQDLTDNLLAIGIAYADVLTTVSPRYAVEIQYPYMGYGLDGLIRTRTADLYGILNGIDVARWNPATDPHIVSHYDADTFVEKRPPNKRQLQQDVGLEARPDVPLLGVVSRLDEQKGIRLLIPALRRLLVSTDVQFVGLGIGSDDLNYEMWRLGQDFHWRARTFIELNLHLAQRIYAGCDLFLMPSYYEPCGIGQMIAMRYGALPLVRETGGLADTVANYDDGPADSGTGFVFNWTETDALLNTIRWALATYHERQAAWQRMQGRAMRLDFSWDKSARQYIEVYNRSLQSLQR
ncbi:MAG: glycogen synthase [Aggregatilineales bacterium]